MNNEKFKELFDIEFESVKYVHGTKVTRGNKDYFNLKVRKFGTDKVFAKSLKYSKELEEHISYWSIRAKIQLHETELRNSIQSHNNLIKDNELFKGEVAIAFNMGVVSEKSSHLPDTTKDELSNSSIDESLSKPKKERIRPNVESKFVPVGLFDDTILKDDINNLLSENGFTGKDVAYNLKRRIEKKIKNNTCTLFKSSPFFLTGNTTSIKIQDFQTLIKFAKQKK